MTKRAYFVLQVEVPDADGHYAESWGEQTSDVEELGNAIARHLGVPMNATHVTLEDAGVLVGPCTCPEYSNDDNVSWCEVHQTGGAQP